MSTQHDSTPSVTVEGLPPFGMVPVWLWQHPEVTDAAVRVWLALWHYADRESFDCWPSRQTLADQIGKSPDTVDRHLKVLVEVGAVTVEHRRDDTGQHSNLYTLHFDPPGRKSAEPLRTDTADPLRTDTADPLRESTAQNKNQGELEPVEPDNAPARSSARPRNLLWETLEHIFGPPPPSQRSHRGRLVKYLKEVDATPAEVARRAELLALEWGPSRCTPASLEKHWHRYDPGAVGTLTEADLEARRRTTARDALLDRIRTFDTKGLPE